jgi:hypothetical protein
LVVAAATALSGAAPGLVAQSIRPGTPDGRELLRLAGAVQDADFRGDLGRLRELVSLMEPFTREPAWAGAAYYWRGFAYWRRALNGANEAGADFAAVAQDFADCAGEFRHALALDSTDLEAQIGAGACLMSLGGFRRADPAQANALWREAQGLLDAVTRRDPRNPRLLFVAAGRLYWTPPAYGGDQQRAIDMVNEWLERWAGAPRPADSLDPGWGEAELHMLVAFFQFDRTGPDLAAAERHARTALAFHPQWHYVKDILLPQIAARRR